LIALAGLARQDLQTQHVLDILPRHGHASSDGRPRVPRIVLSHYPDALVKLQALDVTPDLHFAGHTHGGQVCLPGRVPILRHDTLPRRYCTGVHRFGDTWLVVSRGMGYSTYPIRVFCPAEVVEVVLKAGG
jgi:predicted MPP superfamily phosphohydrolase